MIELEVAAKMTGGSGPGAALLVEVTACNNLSDTVYVSNWLEDWYGWFGDPRHQPLVNRYAVPSRNIAYVCAGNDGTALVLQGDGPDDCLDDPYEPRLPFQSELRAGEELTWTVKLPIPLLEWHSRVDPVIVGTIAVPVKEIQYRLEYVRRKDCKMIEPHRLASAARAEIWRVHGYPTDTAVAIAKLEETVTLRKRMEPEFVRFDRTYSPDAPLPEWIET